MPTPSLPTIRPGLMFLRYNRHLSTVQELQHQQEHLVPDRVHRNHRPPRRPRSGSGSDQPHPSPRRVRPGRIRATKEFPEEQTPSRQDTPVGMNQTPLHTKRYVAESLAVDQQIQVVQRQRSQRVFNTTHTEYPGL